MCLASHIDAANSQGHLHSCKEDSALSPNDVVGLATATGAPNVELNLTIGMSSTRRCGEPMSTEIIIKLAREDHESRQCTNLGVLAIEPRQRPEYLVRHPGLKLDIVEFVHAVVIDFEGPCGVHGHLVVGHQDAITHVAA